MSLLETGEIRHYNYGEQSDAGSFYISSKDNGEIWSKATPSPFHNTITMQLSVD